MDNNRSVDLYENGWQVIIWVYITVTFNRCNMVIHTHLVKGQHKKVLLAR